MMFSEFARTPSRKSKAPTSELTLTTAFVTAVVAAGCRLSYGSLAIAARCLGENDSNQIPAQRGSALVKTLPLSLQPFVCRKAGGYAKGVVAGFGEAAPGDLCDRAVIVKEDVPGAVQEWRDSLSKDA